MTDLGREFDAEQIDPAQAFDIIPSGRYLVELLDSDRRLTKSGKGEYLWLEFQILEGDHAGRKLWDRLNLWHPSQETVRIAEQTFSALCHACGKLQVRETTVLHNIPLIATVRIQPATEAQEATEDKPAQPAREASNQIRGYTVARGTQRGVAAVNLSKPAPIVPNPPAAAPWKASQRRP